MNKVFFLPSKIFPMFIEATLIFWASSISTFFFISSLLELLKGNRFLVSVYLLALVFLIIHFIIRKQRLDRFVKKGKRILSLSEKLEETVTDFMFKAFCALASSVAIFTLFWPSKMAFFISDWEALAEKTAFSFFISIILIIFFIIIIPVAISFLLSLIIPGFADKERKKYLTFALYLILILIFVIYPRTADLMGKTTILELLTNRILQEKKSSRLGQISLGNTLIFLVGIFVFRSRLAKKQVLMNR